MKALRLAALGGPAQLRLDEVDLPRAASDEVVVKVRAAALNHRDVFITKGLYPGIELPRTLGSDGVGELEGRRVVIDPMIGWGNDPRYWNENGTILGMPRDGTFAEYVAVPRANVFDCPPHLSDDEAAAIPLAGLTAFRAVVTRGRVAAGETVLLTGIGGGVQTLALLFAKQAGARVIVTSSSDAKLERARALGADAGVNYRTDAQWYKTVRSLAGGHLDVAIDSAGGETLARALDLMRTGGRVIVYGGTQGEAQIRPFSIFWKHLDVLGTSMGSPGDFAAMLKRFRNGLRPVVDRVFALKDGVAAFERLDQAEQFGKVILRVSA